jgi:APA family basic amino acid/polyamine antiporter
VDKKALSLPILISLVVGNMIGTGIYILPAELAKYGTLSILSWIYTSIGALFLALTFAHLNNRFPKTGGPYIYCKEACGKLVGFIVAYSYWAGYLVSVAGIAVSSVGYLGFITPVLNANTSSYNEYIALAVELGFVWFFTAINMIGIHAAGVFQLILTIIKVIPLFVIIVFGLGHIQVENLTHFTVGAESGFMAISSAAALTFWAFLGLESATVPSENTRGPRDIFKATVYGTLATSIIYIVSTIVLMGMIPVTQLQHSQFPFAEAGKLLFGPSSAILIVICAVLSGLGALNACIMLQGQIVFAAARDHMFPRIFSQLSKNDSPIAGQLFSSSLVTLLLIATMNPNFLKQFDTIALLAAFLMLVVYLTSALAEIKFILNKKMSLHKIVFNRSVWVVLLSIVYSAWMLLSLDVKILLLGILLILICMPVYYFTVRRYIHA